jgi:hypothetical protein
MSASFSSFVFKAGSHLEDILGSIAIWADQEGGRGLVLANVAPCGPVKNLNSAEKSVRLPE